MLSVSVIVPCYNEEATIGLLLQAVYDQSYPRECMEVVIADGRSTDGTRQVIELFQRQHPELNVRLVENAHRTIPAGLNEAIRAANGDVIVRLDAHAAPYHDYVASCVDRLERGLGENVGGTWEILPGGMTRLARSIAFAAAHPLGAGDAKYRIGGKAQAVDTVPFGAFRRSLVERVGYFDETLLTNEDYEFNARVRQSGATVWMDPQIRSRYFARADLSALWRQYWRYGFWKARMLKRHPATIRWRQVIPPIFVLSLVIFAALAFVSPIFRWIFSLEIGLYALAVTLAGVQAVFKQKDWSHLFGVPLALFVMHVAWGSSLWIGLLAHE